MTAVTGGFKVRWRFSVEQELGEEKKAGEGTWTVPSRLGFSIKPSELATAVCTLSDLFGGQAICTPTHESRNTDGGIADD